jgi:hypothetical protein
LRCYRERAHRIPKPQHVAILQICRRQLICIHYLRSKQGFFGCWGLAGPFVRVPCKCHGPVSPSQHSCNHRQESHGGPQVSRRHRCTLAGALQQRSGSGRPPPIHSVVPVCVLDTGNTLPHCGCLLSHPRDQRRSSHPHWRLRFPPLLRRRLHQQLQPLRDNYNSAVTQGATTRCVSVSGRRLPVFRRQLPRYHLRPHRQVELSSDLDRRHLPERCAGQVHQHPAPRQQQHATGLPVDIS